MKFLVLLLLLSFAISRVESSFSFLSWRNDGFKSGKHPSPKNYPAMARYVVHKVDWATVLCKENDNSNLCSAAIFSVADGPSSSGTGVPYLYLSESDSLAKSVFKNNSNCTLMMSLAQTEVCNENKWAPEDPRCAKVFLIGTLMPLEKKTCEHDFAEYIFFEKHPHIHCSSKNFFVKYNIESVKIISGSKGIRTIKLKDYFKEKYNKI